MDWCKILVFHLLTFVFVEEILKGNFVLGAIAVRSMTKIALKLKVADVADAVKNGVSAEVLYTAACMLQYMDLSDVHKEPIAVQSSREEIVQLVKIILDPNAALMLVFPLFIIQIIII